MVEPSNAGPFRIGLDSDLSPGSTRVIEISELKAGLRNVAGHLRKYYGQRSGFDYLFVQNGTSKRIVIDATGDIGFDVPSATSNNVTSPPIRTVRVRNPSSSTLSAGDIDITVGNNVRNPDEEPGFSAREAIEESIPGLNL